MKNVSNSFLLKVIIVIVAVIITVGGFLTYQYFISEEEEEKEEDETASWETFESERYGYQIKYPQGSEALDLGYVSRINLPFLPEANLLEKYLTILVRGIMPDRCSNPLKIEIENSQTAKIGDKEFLMEVGYNDNLYSVSYSIMEENKCYGFSFVFRFDVDKEPFDSVKLSSARQKELEVFEKMMSTFKDLGQ